MHVCKQAQKHEFSFFLTAMKLRKTRITDLRRLYAKNLPLWFRRCDVTRCLNGVYLFEIMYLGGLVFAKSNFFGSSAAGADFGVILKTFGEFSKSTPLLKEFSVLESFPTYHNKSCSKFDSLDPTNQTLKARTR